MVSRSPGVSGEVPRSRVCANSLSAVPVSGLKANSPRMPGRSPGMSMNGARSVGSDIGRVSLRAVFETLRGYPYRPVTVGEKAESDREPPPTCGGRNPTETDLSVLVVTCHTPHCYGGKSTRRTGSLGRGPTRGFCGGYAT